MRELTVVEAVPAVSTHSESMVFLDYGKGRGGEKNKLVRVQTLVVSGF